MHTTQRLRNHNFSMVPSTHIKRSIFNRSHGWKGTIDAGRLIPFYLDEVLPGDTHRLKVNILARLATPILPFMDNLYAEAFFFFVPNRLIWEHWETMLGDQSAGPNTSTDYVVPDTAWNSVISSSGQNIAGTTFTQDDVAQSIGSYFGLPVPPLGNANKLGQISELPLRAYSLVFNEWFRDENLIDPVNIDSETGHLYIGDSTIYSQSLNGKISNPRFYYSAPLWRAKRHDYFTSALPWTQKGDPIDLSELLLSSGYVPIVNDTSNTSVGPGNSLGYTELTFSNLDSLPLAYLSLGGKAFGSVYDSSEGYTSNGSSSWSGNAHYWVHNGSGVGIFESEGGESGSSTKQVHIGSHFGDVSTGPSGLANAVYSSEFSNLVGDLSQRYSSSTGSDSVAFTVNDLRQAFQIQKYLERDARGGTRYIEILKSHFGICAPDFRLQRPEYLGRVRFQVAINQVAQTSSTDATTPQGNLAAYGVASGSRFAFHKSFVEHGYLIGLLNVRADLTYQQGVNKLWLRSDKFDFYWPEFAHLGEQAILEKEIYWPAEDQDIDTTKEVNPGDQIFGYQERYAEYRYFPSIITSKLSSAYAQSLDIWHLAQFFEDAPQLNADFIRDFASYEGVKRVSAVQDEPQFVVDVWFDQKSVRPMPVYSIPGLIDHF